MTIKVKMTRSQIKKLAPIKKATKGKIHWAVLGNVMISEGTFSATLFEEPKSGLLRDFVSLLNMVKP